MTAGRSCSTTALALFGQMPFRRDRTTFPPSCPRRDTPPSRGRDPAFAGFYVFLFLAGLSACKGVDAEANQVITPRELLQDDRKLYGDDRFPSASRLLPARRSEPRSVPIYLIRKPP